MLDIKKLVENKDKYIKRLNTRGNEFSDKINSAIDAYNQYREVILVNEENKKIINENSKLIGEYKREGKDCQDILGLIEKAKEKVDEKKEKELFNIFNSILMTIPNVPSIEVPIGLEEEDNLEIRSWGDIRKFSFQPKSHEVIGEKLDGFDFKRAVKISKSRFVITKNIIARLERAITNLMLDTHTGKGYVEFGVPIVVNAETLYSSGQLPKFENDLFKIARTNDETDEFYDTQRDFYLIPTSEVVLANYYRDEIIEEKDLNYKFASYTQCFRKEAGSAGRDTKGIIRVHQFGKVELFKYTTPETSYKELENMVNDAEDILKLLELPYRVVRLCSGDMGFGAAMTYDIEVWFPAQEQYRECSSCSNVEEFQARRGKIRYRKIDGTIDYVHMLNGSGMATGRILAAVIENYQNEDGTITIPEVLKAYMK